MVLLEVKSEEYVSGGQQKEKWGSGTFLAEWSGCTAEMER
jgi:hypothetical protein